MKTVFAKTSNLNYTKRAFWDNINGAHLGAWMPDSDGVKIQWTAPKLNKKMAKRKRIIKIKLTESLG